MTAPTGRPVTRWTFTDLQTGTAYTVPTNPNTMDSPFPQRNLTATPNAMGTQFFVSEGPAAAVNWSFTITVLSRSYLTELESWAYDHSGLVAVSDHLGRTVRGYMMAISVVPKGSKLFPYRCELTVKMLLTGGRPSAPTAPDTATGAAFTGIDGGGLPHA